MMAFGSKSSEVSELRSSDSIKKGMNSPRVRQDSVQALSKEQKHPEMCQNFLNDEQSQEPISPEGKMVIIPCLAQLSHLLPNEKVGIGSPMSPNWVRPEPSAR